MDDRKTPDSAGIRAGLAKRASPFLSTKEAAFYLGLKPHTLVKMRMRKAGPQYRRHGRHIFYHIDELDQWSAELF